MDDPSLLPLERSQPLPGQALGRLRWRCRRGLLENDLLIERFFDQHAQTLTVGQAKNLYALMSLSDNDLMDLLLRRKEWDSLSAENRPPLSSGERTEMQHLLGLLRLPLGRSSIQAPNF